MDNYTKHRKRRITNLKAIEILKANGINATEEQTNEILNFLYLLASYTVKDYLNDK